MMNKIDKKRTGTEIWSTGMNYWIKKQKALDHYKQHVRHTHRYTYNNFWMQLEFYIIL